MGQSDFGTASSADISLGTTRRLCFGYIRLQKWEMCIEDHFVAQLASASEKNDTVTDSVDVTYR